MDKWRPEGWNTAYMDYFSSPQADAGKQHLRDRGFFDAGADAILEGLKSEGIYVTRSILGADINNKYGHFKLEPKGAGWLLFLPDDREGDDGNPDR